MHILIQNRQRRHPAPTRQIRAVAERILSVLGCPDSTELSVLIVGDRTIRQLNRDYLGKDRPTNVLSFSQQEGESDGFANFPLGDVVISAATAESEAAGTEQSGYQRLLYLLMHGILHLAGYDHERSGEEQARIMRRKERQVWQLLEAEGLTTLPDPR